MGVKHFGNMVSDKARADLHLHSQHSDGANSVYELLERAQQFGLKAVAITDHDTVDGVPQALEYAKIIGIVVVPGVELSAIRGKSEVHILGYYIDPSESKLRNALDEIREHRMKRAARMVQKLNQLGLPITLDDVMAQANGEAVGRPHVAKALVARGFVSEYLEAFHRYLHDGGPAYVPRKRLSPEEAIELIHGAGGVAVLAHPFNSIELAIVEQLIKVGLDGLEVCHPKLTVEETEQLIELADAFNLVITGGTDYHGDEPGLPAFAQITVPYEWVEPLRKRAQRYQ